jgi:hypothetical protein
MVSILSGGDWPRKLLNSNRRARSGRAQRRAARPSRAYDGTNRLAAAEARGASRSAGARGTEQVRPLDGECGWRGVGGELVARQVSNRRTQVCGQMLLAIRIARKTGAMLLVAQTRSSRAPVNGRPMVGQSIRQRVCWLELSPHISTRALYAGSGMFSAGIDNNISSIQTR